MAESLAKMATVESSPENLGSNIFAVTSFPETVCLAPTHFRRARELLDSIQKDPFPFILREEQLYTFSDLKDPQNSLSGAVEQRGIKRAHVSEVFSTPGRETWFMHLMNESINRHMRRGACSGASTGSSFLQLKVRRFMSNGIRELV